VKHIVLQLYGSPLHGFQPYVVSCSSFMWQSLVEINSQIASAEKNGGDFCYLIWIWCILLFTFHVFLWVPFSA
jgi:hypothetical protein